MFRIALVQNLSELRNYSYADLRGDLHRMGFDVVDVTRDNIYSFIPMLGEGVDCVLFATNSLNDSKIYEHVCTEEFCNAFRAYIEKGGSTLVLHQFSLRDKADPLPFLPVAIEKLEKVFGGDNIALGKADKFSEQFFVFPNKISVEQINEYCCRNSAVNGHYWMLLRSPDEWSSILTDNYGNAVVSRMATKKITFSSVPLDYQKHLAFLENILVNLMVDNMSLAIMESNTPDNLGFSYFLNSLENNKLYYKKYPCDADGFGDLATNIALGVHSAILINDAQMQSLPAEMMETINRYGVKLIQLSDKDLGSADSFVVHSIDKRVALVFSKIELRIQEELASGFVSGSFMKTVEVLQKLKEFEEKGMTKGTYTKESVSHVLEKISSRMNEDGSCDKTFGITCKALWLFATFLGKTDKLTKSCRGYVEGIADLDSVRERLERYYTLSLFEKDARAYLTETCAPIINEIIDRDFHSITEYDFLTVMKIALIIADERMLIELFGYVKEHTKETREIFNSYVTAILSSDLIDMYNIIQDVRYKERIRELLFDIVIYLKQVNTASMSVEEVMQVVCALYKFESVVSFPVGDLTEIIFKTGTYPRDYQAFENQITSYQRSRLELDDALNKNKTIKKEVSTLKKYKTISFALLSALAVLLYLFVYLLLTFNDAAENIFPLLFSKIKETWPSLFSLLIVPALTFIYNRYLKKKEDK